MKYEQFQKVRLLFIIISYDSRSINYEYLIQIYVFLMKLILGFKSNFVVFLIQSYCSDLPNSKYHFGLYKDFNLIEKFMFQNVGFDI